MPALMKMATAAAVVLACVAVQRLQSLPALMNMATVAAVVSGVLACLVAVVPGGAGTSGPKRSSYTAEGAAEESASWGQRTID